MHTPSSIIFYDGACGACNRFVMWVLQRDKSNSICFCSLQSERAKNILEQFNEFEGVKSLNTIYFISDNQLYKRSKALINILKVMQVWSYFVRLLNFLPISALDLSYNIFAQNRYIFPTIQCKILTEEEKLRFL